MRLLLPLLLAALTLAGCATTKTGERDARDPYEGFNRGVYAFNSAADTALIRPAATVYRTVTPVPARRGLSRVLANLFEPLNFVNNLLQGKPGRAFNSLGRFVVNSTIGVGGLADHATGMGMPATNEDYGQTLAVYGARKSPYLVLPLLGPSTVRDAAGYALTFLTNPGNFAVDQAGASSTEQLGATGLQILEARSQLIDSGAEALIETSADRYAATRSAYLQLREAQIEDREGSAVNLRPEQEEELLNDALQEGAAAAGASPPESLGGAVPPAVPALPAPDEPRLDAEPVPDPDAMN